MSGGEGDYILDVEYTADFFPHLAPARLAYIAAINGCRAPRLDGRFTGCELGCGQGLTSLILAATHPSGEFHACDFNAAHIERAEALRIAGSVDNLRFHSRSFRELLDENLPPFDFIVAHGVYGWIGEDARADVRQFIRRTLRPGGLVMISYNAMPGWAHVAPIRRMMRAHAETIAGSSLDKARAAFAHVDFLARNGAGYFAALPAAAEHLERLKTHDIRYVAHEYLTPHNDAFWFDEMAMAMAEAGLAFAGSMTPADNYRDLAVPAGFRDHLATLPSRQAAESQRDVIVNAAFRQDLYAAQPPVAASRTIGLHDLGATDYCLADLPDRLLLKRMKGWAQVDPADLPRCVEAIHECLLEGPAPAERIRAAIPGSSDDAVARLIQQLVVSGHLAPCAVTRPPAGWMPLNSALVDAAIRGQRQHVPLACPLTSSACDTEVVSAAVIEAAARADSGTEAATDILGRLRARRYPVNRLARSGERRPATDDEITAHVQAVWQGLRDPANADRRRLRQFGVLR